MTLPIALDPAACDALMPMHVRLDAAGTILSAGPTTMKLAGRTDLIGRHFFEVFAVKRPAGIDGPEGLRRHAGGRLHLHLLDDPRAPMKGLYVAAPEGGGVVNLSFGISVVEAIQIHDLSATDFAPTDLTVEMLYLLEAKAAVMAESRSLNTRLQAARIAAEEQAFTDTLTGLKNRRALDHYLDRLMAQARPFALIHLDLDYFKAVNDGLGHAAGDHVLQQVARVMIAETRGQDIIARAGGDEFLIVLPDASQPGPVLRLCQRIIARLEQPIVYGNHTCRISASAGATLTAFYAEPRLERMMEDADIALYTSKNRGRGRAHLYDPDLGSTTEARTAT